MLVDMHLHECTYSTDSFLHLEEIVSIARQKGLDAICITDHDSMGLRERAEAYSREIGYPIFVGVEFFSLWGDITAWLIPEIPTAWVNNEKLREQNYEEAVKANDPEALVAIIKMIYQRKEKRLAQGKKCTVTDARYFQLA